VRLVRIKGAQSTHGPNERGQAIVEFALVFGLIMLPLVLAIADFGRVYTAMVAIEAAAREAADDGAFQSSNWASAGNSFVTAAEMQQRACTAAAGSHLEDYSGTTGNATCTNPSFLCTIEPPPNSTELSQNCASYPGGYCSTSTSDPPCGVHVSLQYTFRTILSVGNLNGVFTFSRDSIYRVSDLGTAAPSASP
jgi:uncharacterized protein (UPF0333 family)